MWKFNFKLDDSDESDKCKVFPRVKADKRDKSKVDIVLLILIFTGVTAVAHLFYGAIINKYYNREIARGRNLIRWIEYAVTATIMAVILAVVGRRGGDRERQEKTVEEKTELAH